MITPLVRFIFSALYLLDRFLLTVLDVHAALCRLAVKHAYARVKALQNVVTSSHVQMMKLIIRC